MLQGGPKGRTVTGVRCKDRLAGKTVELTAALMRVQKKSYSVWQGGYKEAPPAL